MAKVTVKPTGSLTKIATSNELGDHLWSVARPVFEQARRDPNDYYVSTLEMRRFVTRGRGGRVSIQIGAEPGIGERVEAKRGTLARALGLIG